MGNALFFLREKKKKSCWWCFNLVLTWQGEDTALVCCKTNNWERLVFKDELATHRLSATSLEFREMAVDCGDFAGEEREEFR